MYDGNAQKPKGIAEPGLGRFTVRPNLEPDHLLGCTPDIPDAIDHVPRKPQTPQAEYTDV